MAARAAYRTVTEKRILLNEDFRWTKRVASEDGEFARRVMEFWDTEEKSSGMSAFLIYMICQKKGAAQRARAYAPRSP